MKNENLDLNAMGVVEMNAKEMHTTDGGMKYYVDGLEVSRHAFEFWTKINGVELVDGNGIYWP